MKSSQRDLTDLIGSRICHDLISPIGAISNGVELISMNGDAVGPEMELISQSVDNANARIRFFRIAFGSANADQKISASEIAGILRDIYNGGRLVADWQPTGELSRQQVKLAFLLIQCLESAMPWGGKISVSMIGEQWAIFGQAEQVKFDPKLWDLLSQPATDNELLAASVHFALAPLCADSFGRKLTVESSKNSLRVRF